MHDSNRPGAVHSIDHYTLAVPDLEQARRFFVAFGLAVEALPDRLLLRAADSPHVWGCIVTGSHKHLAYLTFNCHAADYPVLVERIAAMATPAAAHPQAQYADGYWFQDADGNLLQVRVGPKTMVDSKHQEVLFQRTEGRGVAAGRAVTAATPVRPTRLSHVLLFATDVARQTAFYCDALGLRLSDQSAGIIAFLHAPHGCDHHLVAFAKAEHTGWHHASWDVPGVEEVGRGWMQMQQAGYTHVWGPGRHVLGSNYFCYVQDPWGSWCEYSADMDYVPAGQEWPAGDHPPEDSLFLWGPPLPDDFIVNAELAA